MRLARALASSGVENYPKISTEAEALIDAVLRATGEDAGEAMHELHRYIETLEKRKRSNRALAHTGERK